MLLNMSRGRWSQLTALGLFVGTVFTDDLCTSPDDSGSPECSSPYPPGHQDMGASAWAIGDKSYDATILSFVALLTVPTAPSSDISGIMAINPAMENTNLADWSDSVEMNQTFQTLTAWFPWDACNNSPNQWCVFPSAYDYSSSPQQYPGRANIASTGNTVLLNYTYANKEVIQTAMVQGGNQTSPATINNRALEAPWQMWLKTECQCEAQGIIPAHKYTDVVITLDTQVPKFGDCISTNQSSNAAPYSSDGGKTWNIDEVSLSDGYCNNHESCGGT